MIQACQLIGLTFPILICTIHQLMPKSNQDAIEVNAAMSYSVADKTIVMVIMTMV